MFINISHGVFHHHDGIVNNNTNGKDNAKKCNHIDGEPDQSHGGKGTDQGNWDGYQRNKGCPPVLKENKNNDENKNNGNPDGFFNFCNGFLNKEGGVKGDLVLKIRREGLLKFLHFERDLLS